jgi:hypothetical protein
MKLTGINHKMSTAYHPQTDGASERSNKTVIQALRFHVERNQRGWVKALPRVRFHIMNTLNSSTGFSPFVLKTGHSPRLLPPFVKIPSTTADEGIDDATARNLAADFINTIQSLTLAVKDNLLASKITQAHFANRVTNRDCNKELDYRVGEQVLLATAHRQREYMQNKDGRVAKFMPRFDGPYRITQAFPDDSTYRLQLPLPYLTYTITPVTWTQIIIVRCKQIVLSS